MIDNRCGYCIINTYHRLISKTEIPVVQEEDFFTYLKEILSLESYTNAPEVQRDLCERFKLISGSISNYSEEKIECNRIATELYHFWKPMIKASDNSFELALKLAIAGNTMDYGASESFDIQRTIQTALSSSLAIDHSERLKEQIQTAKNILYLTDNAGEIVFDKLFIELMGRDDVTVAVRGGEALNDATMEDALSVGLDSVAKVISNGYNAPSTILEKCSKEFIAEFNSADLIISKGQGNLEGLLNVNDSRIFFLLIAKCDVIAELINVHKGDFVVLCRN